MRQGRVIVNLKARKKKQLESCAGRYTDMSISTWQKVAMREGLKIMWQRNNFLLLKLSRLLVMQEKLLPVYI